MNKTTTRRREMNRNDFQELYTVYDVGICGTCGCPAAATGQNEGYSDCCNDRIEYDMEAAETLQRVLQDAEETVVQTRKRIASLASHVSKCKAQGIEPDADKVRLLENARAWMPNNKNEVKRAKNAIKKFKG